MKWLSAAMAALVSAATLQGISEISGSAAETGPLRQERDGDVIFVAPHGSDTAAGDEAGPLASIHAARDRIRTMKAADGLPAGGVTVVLRGGTYVLGRLDHGTLRGVPGSGSGTAFKLDYEADSGTADSPIRYQGVPGERVTLTLAESLDFRISPIINQAEHVSFADIEVRGGVWDALHRPSLRRVRTAAGPPLRLVEDGHGLATVVIADAATATARYAADELVAHVRRATGVALPVVKEAEAPPRAAGHPRVFIGETLAAEALGLQAATLPPEVSILKTVEGDLFVVGRESNESPLLHGNPWVGTLHGLYEIIDRSLGVRWLWPGELGTYVPKRTAVVVAPVDEIWEPALRYRRWSNVPKDGPTAVFMRRHGAGNGTRPHIGHHFQHWQKLYAERHPDWFALDKAGDRSGKTICVSNLPLRRQVVERRSRPGDTTAHGAWAVGTFFDDHWNGGNQLTLGEADSTEWCRCAPCLALDAIHPETLNLRHVWMKRVLADRYVDFMRDVLSQARRINPGVRVSTFLYWQTFHAPLGEVDLGPDFHGEFVPWMGKTQWFPMPDDAVAHVREQWLGWKRTGMSMAYRPNYFHGGYVLPFFSTHQAGEFLRFTVEQGSVGWSGDSLFGQWATQGPMLYMHMRLLRNPTLSVADARAEYFSGFGPAAAEIERYFDFWEDFAQQVVASHPWPVWGLDQMVKAPRIYTPEVFARAAAILDEAREAARNDIDDQYAQRVEFIRLGLDHAAATMRFVALLDSGAVVLHDRGRFEATQQAWRKLRALRQEMANPTGVADGQRVSAIDLEHIEGLEARWLKGLAQVDQPFDAVRLAKPDPLSPWGPWLFRTDPDDRGVRENWFARDVAAESWREIVVPAPWSDTWNSGYVGFGWYRTTFRFPREWAGEPLRLSFGGVADQAWVFVNGVAVGEHSAETMNVESLRTRPFEIMVPDTVMRPGEVNTLVVRVHSSTPDGGIRERVDGAAPHPEDRRRLPSWAAP